MSKDLLDKEREFRRMNNELQERTRDVMKEVEVVMAPRADQWQPWLLCNLNTSKSACGTMCKNESEHSSKLTKPHSNLPQDDLSNKTELKECRDETLKCKESPANKAIVNVLNGKIDMLMKELQTIRTEYRKKSDYCKQLELESKKFDDQKFKLQSSIEGLKDGAVKQEAANAELQSQSQVLQAENNSLKKDLEGLKRRVKALQQESNNHEMRLNRTIEENEKAKNSVKVARIEEKELRAEITKLNDEKTLSTKKWEKQRSDLVNTIKKQILLIDNLKKQIAYMATAVKINFRDDEFQELLKQLLDDL